MLSGQTISIFSLLPLCNDKGSVDSPAFLIKLDLSKNGRYIDAGNRILIFVLSSVPAFLDRRGCDWIEA